MIYELHAYPVLDIDGFSWAENLAFDGEGNLFVSDTEVGVLYRITLSDDGNSYQKFVHVAADIFKKIDGLTMSPSGFLLASVRIASSLEPWIVAIDTNEVNTFKLLVPLPVMGNGLALYHKTGMIFTTYEGNFIPGKGAVYLADPYKNQTSVVVEGLGSSDGCFIDQERGLLYISEVLTAHILCFSIGDDNSLTQLNRYRAPNMVMLDDFTLNQNGTEIYAADYINGTVVVFQADGSSENGYILMEDLNNPTSVRFESGPGFNSTSVFVTEGGGFTKFVTDRRVIQSPYALGIETF